MFSPAVSTSTCSDDCGLPEVVVTLGSAGALVVTEQRFERIAPVVIDEIVDPTGAGDSFSAAYLHARSEGAAPIQAARFANELAAELLRAPAALGSLVPPSPRARRSRLPR